MFRAVILLGLYKKGAYLVKGSLGQLSNWNRWIAGVALILLLLIPGGASLAAQKADIGSDSAAGGRVGYSPTASNGSHWLRIRLNLSGSPNVVSGYPDLAMSSDGTYVAVVWTEGYDSTSAAKHHGRVYLRWISEDTGNWSSKIPVIGSYYPSATDWATDAAIALQGTTAHIVFVRYQALLSRYTVWYASCALNPLGTTCNLSSGALQTDSGALASPDIAADSSGNVFTAWSRESGSYREIQYAEFNGTTWSGPEQASTDNTVNDWPAVAVQGSTVHVAWIRTITTKASVAYRQRPVGGGWSSAFPDYPYTPDSSWSRYPYMTSGGSTVYLGWETFQSGNYQVNYKYYDTGPEWQPSSPLDKKSIPSTTSLYSASTSGDEYLQYLRPTLAVDNEGDLHAVWHHYDGGEEGTLLHRVLYSHSENPTAATPTWDEPVVFAELSGNEDLTPEERHFSVDNVAARIAVGPPRGTEPEHIHVVLMARTGSAWDVWYLSNQLYKEVSLTTVAKNY